MIFLITGASHTGKTVLARRLAACTHASCLSIDLLKMGLIRSGQTALMPEDDNALTAYLWPIVREIIKTAIENRQNLIVEGCYVPSDWPSGFPPAYLHAIRFCCLVMTPSYIAQHFSSIRAHACDAERRLDDSACTPEALRSDNAQYLALCRSCGHAPFLIDRTYRVSPSAVFPDLFPPDMPSARV